MQDGFVRLVVEVGQVQDWCGVARGWGTKDHHLGGSPRGRSWRSRIDDGVGLNHLTIVEDDLRWFSGGDGAVVPDGEALAEVFWQGRHALGWKRSFSSRKHGQDKPNRIRGD